MLTRVLIVVGIVLTSGSVFAAEACAHRGDTAVAPENTIPAFESAVKKGAGMIEFDVQLSKDGHLVIMHDPAVNRTTNGEGSVSDHTFDELRALDAGSWFGETFKGVQIPTLRETLEAIPKNILCNVHLKNSPGVAAASAKLIEEMGRLDQCFLACTVEQGHEAKAVVPAMRICNMSRQGRDRGAYVELTIDENCEFIQLHQNNKLKDIEEAVAKLHKNGVTINYFGANEPKFMRALDAAGVDYILTDKLDLCLETLATDAR